MPPPPAPRRAGASPALTFDVDLYTPGHGQPLVVVGLAAEDRHLRQT